MLFAVCSCLSFVAVCHLSLLVVCRRLVFVVYCYLSFVVCCCLSRVGSPGGLGRRGGPCGQDCLGGQGGPSGQGVQGFQVV